MKAWLVMMLALAATLGPVRAAEPPEFILKPASKATLDQVRGGGYVLYMRHGSTDSTRPDRAPQVDLNDCSTQRPLTEEGRRLAARLGDYLRKAAVPLAEIYASPLCRAKESAQAAFGERFKVEVGLMYSGNMTSEEKQPTLKKTRELLSRPVKAGGNRLIVAHAPNLMDLIGYFPKPEGTIVVFRPLNGDGFEYVASILPDQWPELLK